jgi:hypothetical protein
MVQPITPDTRREWRIIALASVYLDVSWHRIRSNMSDHRTAKGRQLLCYVLARAGYRPVQISRMLGQNYTTVCRAVRQVEHDATLGREGRRLAEAILPIASGEPGSNPISAMHLKVLSRTLMRGLLGTVSLQDMRAIRAYVCGTLLGRERVPAAQAMWGLWLLARHPGARAVVDEALDTWALCPYRGLIDAQMQRMGMR